MKPEYKVIGLIVALLLGAGVVMSYIPLWLILSFAVLAIAIAAYAILQEFQRR